MSWNVKLSVHAWSIGSGSYHMALPAFCAIAGVSTSSRPPSFHVVSPATIMRHSANMRVGLTDGVKVDDGVTVGVVEGGPYE